jgi:hypothetical protein
MMHGRSTEYENGKSLLLILIGFYESLHSRMEICSVRFSYMSSQCVFLEAHSVHPPFLPLHHTKQGGLKRKGTKEKESEKERERQKENKEKKEVNGNMLTGYY